MAQEDAYGDPPLSAGTTQPSRLRIPPWIWIWWWVWLPPWIRTWIRLPSWIRTPMVAVPHSPSIGRLLATCCSQLDIHGEQHVTARGATPPHRSPLVRPVQPGLRCSPGPSAMVRRHGWDRASRDREGVSRAPHNLESDGAFPAIREQG